MGCKCLCCGDTCICWCYYEKPVVWVLFYAKTLLLSIEKVVVWVVSFVHREIRVFALNLWTGCWRQLQIVCMYVLTKNQEAVVSVVSMLVWVV